MKYVNLGKTGIKVPVIAVGCMRISDLTKAQMTEFIQTALDNNVNFFDHADIYGGGQSETLFGEALADSSIKREDIIIQSKCGIRRGFYDFSKEYLLNSVDGILKRLKTDYLDVLLLHRPDALCDPEEVAEVFDILQRSGKVRYFGVSNHKPMQIELLKKYVSQDIVANQMQFSIPVSNMVASGIEANLESAGSADRDGNVLDYSRLNDITIQAWSPFQMADWKGCFIGSEEYPELNKKLDELALKYNVTNTAIAAAWILRHPANMQLVTGTASCNRLKDIIAACDITLTREEWYSLYLAAGHILP